MEPPGQTLTRFTVVERKFASVFSPMSVDVWAADEVNLWQKGELIQVSHEQARELATKLLEALP